MRAGKLRQKVTFEARTKSVDAIGGRQDTWSTIATRRCDIKPLMGKESVDADAIEYARTDTEIRVRYDSTLAQLRPHDRAVDYSHSPAVVYDIDSIINPQERDRELVLRCTRDAAR